MDKKRVYLVDQVERAMEDEVAAILDQVKPGWAKNMTLGIESGSGVVLDSFFTFSKKASYWIVIVGCEYGRTFAFLPIAPDWIQVYAQLILQSPELFVTWDVTRRITSWVAEQTKLVER